MKMAAQQGTPFAPVRELRVMGRLAHEQKAHEHLQAHAGVGIIKNLTYVKDAELFGLYLFLSCVAGA